MVARVAVKDYPTKPVRVLVGFRPGSAADRARLLTLARKKRQAFELLLTRYAIERLLIRF
jgi:hypothetical protein